MHMLNGVIGVVPYLGKPVKKLNTMLLVILAFLGARNAYFGRKDPVPGRPDNLINYGGALT